MICYSYDNYRRCKVDWGASIYLSIDGSATKHGSLGVTLDVEKLDES